MIGAGEGLVASPFRPPPDGIFVGNGSSQWNAQQDERRHRMLDLFERLFYQVTVGCEQPSCTTPTCLSYRLQHRLPDEAPVRVPSEVTARAMASFMIAQDHPSRSLCPLLPVPHQIPRSTGHALWTQARLQGLSSGSAPIGKSIQNHQLEMPKQHPLSSDRIDHKSLVQVLFNTMTWKTARFLECRGPGFRLVSPPSTSELELKKHKASENDPEDDPPEEAFNGESFVDEKLELLDDYGSTVQRPYVDTATLSKRLSILGLASARAMDNLAKTFRDPLALQLYFSKPAAISSPDLGPASTENTPLDAEETVRKLLSVLRKRDLVHVVLLSLWQCLGQCYRHRPESISDFQFQQEKTACDISDETAAHIIVIALAALCALVRSSDPAFSVLALESFSEAKRTSQVLVADESRGDAKTIDIAISLDDDLALDLMRRILRVYASHSYVADPSYRHGSLENDESDSARRNTFTQFVAEFWTIKSGTALNARKDLKHANVLICLEWSRAILYEAGTSDPVFKWNSDTGCAIEFMRMLFDNKTRVGLEPRHFAMKKIFNRLDFLETPIDWLMFKSDQRNQGHLLDFPFLFESGDLVTFFRAINHACMFNAFASTVTISTMVMRLSAISCEAQRQLLDRLNTATASFLTLEIRRERILEDALDQLWRRQRRELLRPLKVRMGMHEGEEGVDLGGVQQEFFRLALSTALDPAFGLFTVDTNTQMAWFQPLSTAPLRHYMLVGLLVGLALYNGITLPLTFPLAFYRKILGLPVTSIQSVKDGWPDLARGLEMLRDWPQDDVEETFSRTYAFSSSSLGKPFDVDMIRYPRDAPWPSNAEQSPTDFDDANDSETPMVTKTNRHQYIQDYIYWLTDKSIRPQYEAFASGFFLPLNRKSLRLFEPASIKNLLEGSQIIEVDALQSITKYENGFDLDHPVIENFWTVVRALSPDELRRLLEFVTASERVPVRGIQEITFVIQRNGDGDRRLPTSMTCFGRLLLPAYSTREVLEVKLRAAIENSRGFGVA